MHWQVLIPLRASGAGKSRLRGTTRDDRSHPDLVRAIQRDAVAAVRAARDLSADPASSDGPLIGGIHLVTTQPPDDWGYPDLDVLADLGGGLNKALIAAAAAIGDRCPGDGVLAMVADLPALRASDLLQVLAAAADTAQGFVADAAGTGTTMLAAQRAADFRPAFGAGSAERHRAAGFRPLPAPDGARCDVDTADDLQHCLRLGVGEHTAAMLSHLQPFN